MNKPLTALAVAGLMVASSGQAAAAKPVPFEGTTKGGFAISFKRSGAKISQINAVVPTTCVPAGSGTPRSGGDVFRPPRGLPLRDQQEGVRQAGLGPSITAR